MVMLTLPPLSEDWLIVEATPSEKELEDLNIRDKGTISSLLGAKNEVWIGQPRLVNLYQLAISDIARIAEMDKLFLESTHKYDYILVQLACSFRPATSCEFVKASVEIEVSSPISTGISATAYELFPVEVFLPVTYKRQTSISPSLKLGFEKLMQVDVSAFKAENSSEYLIYQPEITAFGKGDPVFGWDFNKSSGRTIRGIKDLFVILQREKATALELEIRISNCQIQTNIGKIPLSTYLLLDRNREVLNKKVAVPSEL